MRGGGSTPIRRILGHASVALLVMGLLAPAAGAEEGDDARPIARVEVTPRAAIVGSPMELRITLLVPTWFTGAPEYPSFEVAGLIVRRPPNSTYKARETIDGVVYSGIVREYQIYPQRAANYLLDGESLADRLKDDGYDSHISLESVYRPEGGTFEDGFKASVEKFKALYG